MNKKYAKVQSARKSLIMSVLSLMLSVAMLIGTTYAWFTDSVTSGRNKIVAGNLDVELYHNGTKVTDSTSDLFDVDAWEPGVIAYENFEVVNEGNLALKYAFSLNVFDKNTFKGKDLSQVIKAVVVDGGFNPTGTTPEAKRAEAQALEGYSSIADFQKNGHLDTKNASNTYGVVLYWEPTDHDNDYNVNNGNKTDDNKDALFIEFGVNLVATQYTYEADSFDKYYDAGTPWLGGTDDAGLTENTKADTKTVEIQSADQLASFAKAVNAGTTYDGYTVKLMKDIDLNNVEWTQINGAGHKITFDGNNKTIKNLKISNGHSAGFFATGSGCTIKDLTFEDASVTAVGRGAVVCGHGMCVTVDNCKVSNSTVTAAVTNDDDGDKAGAIVGYLSGEPNAKVTNCTVEGCTVTGYRDTGALVGYAGGTYTVTGNTVKNCTVINDRTNNYKNYDEDAKFDVHEIIGEEGTAGTVENNTATNVTIELIKAPIVVEAGETQAATQANVDAKVAAATAGDVIVLPNTDNGVRISAVASGVTLKGDGNTKIDVTGPAYTSTANINGATLDGLVIECGQNAYHGFQHSDAVIKNCTIKGLLFSYNAGGEQVFENCTFIQTNKEYNMWAYGAVTYKKCTFKGYGKFVNVYNEGAGHFDVNFEDCKFINLDTAANKSAINVKDTSGTTQLSITVTIKKCTYEGVAPETVSNDTLHRYNPVVQLDDISGKDSKIVIKQDDATLWPEA